MNYKGYIGHVEFDEDNAIFVGEIINTKDIITFQSDTAHGLKQEFIDSIEDYLDFCKARNEAPQKPFSGKFNLRISPELHREIYIAAKHAGMSINSWVSNALKHAM